MTHRRALHVVLAALLVLGLAACGEREEPVAGGAAKTERVDLVLDWFPNADHAGIYAAIAGGQFEQAGLDVKPRAPGDTSSPLKLLAAGKADLLRAGAPARPREGGEARRDRRARAEAADLDHLDRLEGRPRAG